MTEPALHIAVVQCSLGDDVDTNVARVERLVRQAAKQGAKIILPPELFETPYFPQHKRKDAFALATPISANATVKRMQSLAAELEVVLPVSVFEQSGDAFYNTVVVIDANGSVLGTYRKSHIPDGPGYEEKFYFTPGDTGFRMWETRHGRIGVGICWDQWFPEAARAMSILGADALLYPTAIGSEPAEPDVDTRDRWQRVMVGHAVANAIPVAAANRIGREDALTFYGSSFIVDPRGDKLVELGRDEEGIATASLDRAELRAYRKNWNFFRDRRPELYGPLTEEHDE